ncbi:uncharacterized protein CCOS01_01080 [Colletotrichum costaricense]|uniref:Uncharacterized protein n=1 Tax=Colletotrichum costaricense TaxID=1209916 RepID=A0AAI9ZAA1_9PEZI|nr:uncharacterized protein CCOS01_01080 [Colletotrichum costaricense]KAK1539766.1 hypothetical protein CCOS01_01080 [Colletotrichum costaricense]
MAPPIIIGFSAKVPTPQAYPSRPVRPAKGLPPEGPSFVRSPGSSGRLLAVAEEEPSKGMRLMPCDAVSPGWLQEVDDEVGRGAARRKASLMALRRPRDAQLDAQYGSRFLFLAIWKQQEPGGRNR